VPATLAVLAAGRRRLCRKGMLPLVAHTQVDTNLYFFARDGEIFFGLIFFE
jgi:hypothetical protein